MLNRWVRTWNCVVRTEHRLELDCLDFETGSVGMLLLFGYFNCMWHHVRNNWNNQVFVYLPQITKKCHCATVTPIQKQSLQTKNPIIWAHAAIKRNGGHVNQKKEGGGEVWWIGNENNCAFSAVKLHQHQKLQMCLDLWPAFWTTFLEQQECQVKTSLAWQVNFGNGMECR